MNLRHLSALAALTLALGSLQARAATFDPALNNHDVAGTWQVVGPTNALEGTARTPTLTLDHSGQLSGFAGCNTFTGGYAARGSALLISPLAATRMACPPAIMQAESNVLDALSRTFRLNVDGDMLHLYSAGGQQTLLLRRATPALGLAADDANMSEMTDTARAFSGTFSPTLFRGEQELAAVDGAALKLEVTEEGRINLSGKVGCNQLNASGTLAGNAAQFDGLQSTRMLCSPAEAEAEAALSELLDGPVRVTETESSFVLEGRGIALQLQTADTSGAKVQSGNFYAEQMVLGSKKVDAAGISVQLDAQKARLIANAGCNSLIFGLTRTDSGWQVAETGAATLMLCEPNVLEKEQALSEVLQGATLSQSGGALLVASPNGKLTLRSEQAGPQASANIAGHYYLTELALGNKKIDLNGFAQPVTLHLTRESGGYSVSGSDGCNTMGGEVKLEGTRLKADNLIGTLAYCESLDRLPNLGKALLAGVNAQFDSETLTLSGDGVNWTFTRE